ncbi:MAG: helix-turn-helix domain-containing protein [Candidatus Omnitrophota bacterium]|jgi:cytoskeletal protein RodZ|nr:MAG: helix-turn-helix domain-containing protein [Candidatus Omnitrophota bacterium]
MMESSGERLKKIRLSKGLSLEEAYKKTKIHLNVLKAIEDDNIININPIYLKGFLKIYCRFLGVDPKDFVPEYKDPHTLKLAALETQGNNKLSFMKSAAGKLGYLGSDNFRKIRKVLVIGLAILVILFVLFNLGKFIKHRLSILFSKKSSISSVSKVNKDTANKQVQKNAGVSLNVMLTIVAKEDCWINLKVDGRTVFQSVLKKGRSETWEAKDKMELTIGNAGIVSLEVNGQSIPPLGRKGQVIKNILITKEGIVTRR